MVGSVKEKKRDILEKSNLNSIDGPEKAFLWK